MLAADNPDVTWIEAAGLPRDGGVHSGPRSGPVLARAAAEWDGLRMVATSTSATATAALVFGESSARPDATGKEFCSRFTQDGRARWKDRQVPSVHDAALARDAAQSNS